MATEESGIKVVHGSGVFLTPFFQKASKLSLTSRAIDINALAQDKNGITLTVDAVAIVKVGEEASAIRAAAQRFLGQEKNIEVAETNATREAKEASVQAEQAVAEAENTLALKKAALQLDTDKAAAEAAAAKPLAEAKAQQAIVQQQELTANADRDSRIAAAQAVRGEGEAQAEAILARGKAEAETTRLSTEAVAEQSQALIQLRRVEMLPQIAHELAAPISNIDQLTVISTDGASQLTKNVASGFSEVDSVLASTMDVGIKDLLGSLLGGAAAGAAFGKSAGHSAPGAPLVIPTDQVDDLIGSVTRGARDVATAVEDASASAAGALSQSTETVTEIVDASAQTVE